MRVAELARRRVHGEVLAGLVGQQRHLPAQHRDIDIAPLAGALPAVERGDDGVGREHAAADIGNRHPEARGWPAGMTSDAHHAAGALHDQVIGLSLIHI